MLTDSKLKSLKPRDKLYKVSDRDGLYVAVTKSGTISFRFDYRFNGRRETLVLGKYGLGGLTLLEARARLADARKLLAAGESPAKDKQKSKLLKTDGDTFSDFFLRYLESANLAESTKVSYSGVYSKHIEKSLGKMLMSEIKTSDVRTVCDSVLAKGTPCAAFNTRNLINTVFEYHIGRGYEFFNPAKPVKRSSLHEVKIRERVLTPAEFKTFFAKLGESGNSDKIKGAIRLLLYTFVRKNELLQATWDEFDFNKCEWVIPAHRMKRRKTHVVYLSRQAVAILNTLPRTRSGLLFGKPVGQNTLNAALRRTCERMGIPRLTVHDLRRTADTYLHELGFNADWIEKSLAHEQKGTRRFYNMAEYEAQRRDMAQQWADIIDKWIENGASCPHLVAVC